MATYAGKIKVLYDNQLRTTANGTVNGTAQSKGTATDVLVQIVAGPDGATAVAGTTTPAIQGSNDGSTWTAVTADKGTIAAITASGTQTLHFAQLQYKQYRIQLVGTGSAVSDVSVAWAFHPMSDSFDSTVA